VDPVIAIRSLGNSGEQAGKNPLSIDLKTGGIVLWTDGLTEAVNENEEEYGLQRVKQQVTNHSEESLKVLCEMLLGEARRFGKQMDDQSVLLVRRL
jgi:serine phosphatase RsbU (regulator of sigma subunit)